jgi:tetratricopeptide (TPR) repeat protein
VVERISASQPLVLLLDDLQWADETTLQVLHFLTRQPQLNRMLMVGAYRPGATSGGLDHLVPSSRREPSVRSIDLQPLGLPGLATVLGARLGGICAPGLARAVHERSGGNPFFALEIVGLLQQEGRLEQVRGGLGTVWTVKEDREVALPAAVRDTVAQRLKGLKPAVVEALQLAAVIGRQVAYTTLTDLWKGGERSLLRALDTAIAAQILEERDTGYAFRHPVLQEVVYRQLSAAHRAWLHAQVAHSLEALYGTRADEHASELAYHVVAAGQDGARGLHYLTLAADASVRASSWQEALTAYRAALPYAGADRAIAEIQERIGGVLTALGRYDEALVALEEAVAHYERVGDLLCVGAVTAALVHGHALRGSWDQGRAHATRVMGQIEQLGPESSALSRVLADLYLALTYLYDVGLEQRLHAAGRAAELARAAGDNGLLARAEMRRSLMLYALRRFPQAQEVIAALIPIAEGVRDSSTLRFAVDILADIHKLEGRFADCLRGRERALAYAEERPAEPHWLMVSLAQLAEARFLLGDWAGARSLYERAVQMSRLYPTPHYAAFALLGLGALNLAEGRWEEATQLIETCIADTRSTNDVHWVRNAERLLAYRDLLLGRPDEALQRMEHDGDDHPGTLYLRAWAHLEVGESLQAATTVERCIMLATERNNRLDLAEGLIVQGRICSRHRQFADAAHAFADALSLARSMSYPLAEGRTLYEWGRTLAAAGKRQEAREQLENTLQIFQRLGARPFMEQTDHALRRLEPRSRKAK